MSSTNKKLPINISSILVVLLVGASFAVGTLWQKVQNLENTTSTVVGAAEKTAPAQPQGAPQAGEVDPVTAEDHINGNSEAKIALIEYSDLECPFCQLFHPTAQQAVDEYPDDVMWVYRHFPLTQIHSKAPKEAEAVECANELGGNEGFWALTNKIFETTPANNGLNLDDLPKLASEVGIDKNDFKTCLDSGKYADHVEADYQSGIRAGVSGTPGNILLNIKTGETQLIPGAVPFPQLQQAIDAMLK